MDSRSHPYFVASADYGTRQETAVMLVGTAREFGVPQRDIASTFDGFRISQALADVLYEEEVADGPDPEEMFEVEPVPVVVAVEVPKKAPAKKASTTKKTSGNRAVKNTNTDEESA